jgi:hypothetical protein
MSELSDEVALFEDGEWQSAKVDRRLPTLGGSELLCAHAAGPAAHREQWVAMVEKGAAVLAGGYAQLSHAGTIDSAMAALSGPLPPPSARPARPRAIPRPRQRRPTGAGAPDAAVGSVP